MTATKHTFKITYLRDTDYSFVQTTVRSDGMTFARKLEKGSPEYGNICTLFHRRDVMIEKGNTVLVEE